jgi:type I restriction enzyme R subunit
MYEAFEGFDQEDLEGTLTSVHAEVARLPQRYSDLWDLFRAIKNKRDEEAFEVHLADDELRENFYQRLAEYSKTLGIALSTAKFMMETDEETLQTYKKDLKRFHKLRKSVQLRYAETIDYRDYEPKIKKLLDTHIRADKVTQLNEPVDILDDQTFDAVKQGQGIHSSRSTAARADTIAHATKKVIHEKMEEDPAFYKKFSELIQTAIDDFKEQRISDLDYLKRASDLHDQVVAKKHDDVPDRISDNDEACAYYGAAKEYFDNQGLEIKEETAAYMAESFQDTFEKANVVDFWKNENAINEVKNQMDDFFYDDLKGRHGIELDNEQMNEIIEQTLKIAKSRRDQS